MANIIVHINMLTIILTHNKTFSAVIFADEPIYVKILFMLFIRCWSLKAQTPFEPAGDQPTAIKELNESILKGNRYQTLEGVTGSGKTYTMAKVIKNIKMPTIIMTHNKILAAQL